GKQVAYVGPYNLLGKDYKDQEWFNETSIKGVHISEVFLGYRNLPHFLIAILNETENLNYYIIRSTIDTDELYRQITAQKLLPSSDAFLINKDGVLQTPSRFHGDVLETTDVPIPRYADEYGVIERDQVPDAVEILGYAYINNSPFILLETFHPESMMGDWLSGRNDILLILTISITVILIVIVWGSRHMVRQIEISDQKRTRILHQVEYTSKMASIGRLAAGVSHEINNPLAIINENAGMIQDILSVTSDFPRKEKVLKNINSITRSVERCSKITHRLLGFAKRIDTQTEDIRLDELIKEVAGFMSRESMARNIKFIFENIESDIEIRSDRGQLQQVFLNIINNAVDAVDDGGVIRINIIRSSEEFVKVSISDNGEGIPPGEIDRIFEPFFTRKKEKGTGLGLAITYGIIQKLGGRIEVDSQLNVGTNFDIFLPVNPPSERINHEV
ncbi:MAG: sensor histidine kinase, partial [Candidatus Kapaibacterium sp.]